jgi:hypothetical protein
MVNILIKIMRLKNISLVQYIKYYQTINYKVMFEIFRWKEINLNFNCFNKQIMIELFGFIN